MCAMIVYYRKKMQCGEVVIQIVATVCVTIEWNNVHVQAMESFDQCLL